MRIEGEAVVGGVRGVAPSLQERVFGEWRFGFSYVDPGAAEVTAGDGVEHVHDSAARGVDEERAARHLRDGFAVHDVVRLGRERGNWSKARKTKRVTRSTPPKPVS